MIGDEGLWFRVHECVVVGFSCKVDITTYGRRAPLPGGWTRGLPCQRPIHYLPSAHLCWFRVYDTGFRGQGLGFSVYNLGFSVYDLGFGF